MFKIKMNINRITNEKKQAHWDYVTEGLKNKLIRLIKAGKTPDGTSFEDYNVSYKIKKRSAGKYTGTVDLTWTGQLIASIDFVVGKTYFRIFIDPSQQSKAKKLFKIKNYNFMYWGDEMRKELDKLLQEAMYLYLLN